MPPDSFSAERLHRLTAMEPWHFWFEGRRRLVRRLLHRHAPEGGRVLDAGCGSGALADTLARDGGRVVALDQRPEGLQRARQGGGAHLVQGDATRLPLRGASVDVVLLLDLLEHLDDARSLREVAHALRAGGVLIVTVPALPWLWSYRDRAAGHLRRYSRRGLRRLLAQAGLEVREVRYYQFLLFPLVAMARLLGRNSARWRDREERPGPLNGVLRAVNCWEARLGDFLPWPWGSSLVAVARKA